MTDGKESRSTVLLVVAAVVVLGLFLAFGNPQAAPKSVDAPFINVNEYSYKVSSQKPAVLLATLAEVADAGNKVGTELTVYNQNLALVKEVRELMLKSGLNLVKYEDVASQIDATSVMFHDLSNEKTFVVEQNYEYDLVSKNKLLEKYLDKEITVEVEEGDQVKSVTGKLLSYGDGLTLRTGDGVVSLASWQNIKFPALPEGLLVKPTLMWKLWTDSEGQRNTQTAYLTGGIKWRADYIAEVNDLDTEMDLTGWTTIENRSGTRYPNARLKLVAGDVHRVYRGGIYAEDAAYKAMPASEIARAPSFSEQGLFEYHLYTLDRETTLNNNETKQINLLNAVNVPVNKELVYDGALQGDNVQVKLKFKNEEAAGLGMPMPAGVVRVYKRDNQGQLQFVGEDQLDHTPNKAERKLFLGNAFDVEGERTQTEYREVSKEQYWEKYEIKLLNGKKEPVQVTVVEHLYGWDNWEIRGNSDPFEKKDSTTIEFKVTVPAESEKTISYIVDYRQYKRGVIPFISTGAATSGVAIGMPAPAAEPMPPR